MYFKPSYLPHNETANVLVKALAAELGLSLNKRYEIVLASFLAIAKKVNGQTFDWWTNDNNKKLKLWNIFPHVTNQYVSEVYNLLKVHEYISPSKDFPNQITERMGIEETNWIKAQRLPKYFLERSIFVESNLPYVLVNKPESYENKRTSLNQDLTSPKLGIKQTKKNFGRDYTLACSPIVEMNTYWAKHPLYNPIDDEFYSSAIRIFHNGSIKSGGRWYGGWTDFEFDQSHRFEIDNQPVVHVDVNAMVLCLLSYLTGKPMNMIGVWWDIYNRVVCQIPNVTNSRKKVKEVIRELTGSGNPNKSKPSPDNEIIDDQKEFIHIRDLCIDAYPALKFLDKEQLNFTNDLSFHEANVLTETLLSLKKMGIVAYPVHDCIIVRMGDEFDAMETFKRVFRNYVSSFESPNVDLDLALTVKFDPSNKVGIQGSF